MSGLGFSKFNLIALAVPLLVNNLQAVPTQVISTDEESRVERMDGTNQAEETEDPAEDGDKTQDVKKKAQKRNEDEDYETDRRQDGKRRRRRQLFEDEDDEERTSVECRRGRCRRGDDRRRRDRHEEDGRGRRMEYDERPPRNWRRGERFSRDYDDYLFSVLRRAVDLGVRRLFGDFN